MLVKQTGVEGRRFLTRIGHERIFLSGLVGLPQAIDQLLVLVLQSPLVRLSHLIDFLLEILGTTSSLSERVFGNISAQRLDTDIVDVVGLIKNNNAILRQVFGDAFGNFWIEQVVIRVYDDIAELHLLFCQLLEVTRMRGGG